MISKRRSEMRTALLRLGLLFTCIALAAGCGSMAKKLSLGLPLGGTTAQILSPEEALKEAYLLRTSDEISISLIGHSEGEAKTIVREDGTVLHPLLGSFPALDRTLRELETDIEKQLQLKFTTDKSATHETEKPASDRLSPSEAFGQIYQLQPGDQLEISVWQHAELSQKIFVREDGTLSFPLLGTVQAAGRAISEVEREIRDRLAADYLVDPQVTVHLFGTQFSVLGQRGQSGTFPIEGNMDLLTAVSKVGDIETLKTDQVEILRHYMGKQIVIETNVNQVLEGQQPNVSILPRDMIYLRVPITEGKVSVRLIGGKFTILGEVNSPGTYLIEGSTDVLAAISLAGGISKFGSSRIEVIRTRGKKKVVIRADISRILKGADPNFPILPRDTIFARRRLF